MDPPPAPLEPLYALSAFDGCFPLERPLAKRKQAQAEFEEGTSAKHEESSRKQLLGIMDR